MTSEATNRSRLAPIYAAIRREILNLEACLPDLIRRESNGVAHELTICARIHGDMLLESAIQDSAIQAYCNDFTLAFENI
jgi:hypothetical protein